MPTDPKDWWPAWKIRRFERLGLAIPDDARKPREPSQAVAEHGASLADLRAIEEAERDAD